MTHSSIFSMYLLRDCTVSGVKNLVMVFSTLWTLVLYWIVYSSSTESALTEAFEKDPQSLWDTNFFGKSLKELIREGVNGKLSRLPADTQEKVQSALTRMLNEGEGGMICILL